MSMPSQFTAEPPPRSSGGKWILIILVVMGGVGVCCCGMPVGLMFFGLNALADSEPVKISLDQLRQNEALIQELGEPIELTGFPMGSINIRNQSGDASLDFWVKGPKGTASVHSESEREHAQWRLVKLTAVVDGGSGDVIDVLDGAELP